MRVFTHWQKEKKKFPQPLRRSCNLGASELRAIEHVEWSLIRVLPLFQTAAYSAPLARSNYMYYQSLHINLSISSSLDGSGSGHWESMSEGQRGASSWILVIKMAGSWRQLDGWRDERALLLVCSLCPSLIAFYRVTNHGCALELLLLRVFLSAEHISCAWTAIAIRHFTVITQPKSVIE